MRVVHDGQVHQGLQTSGVEWRYFRPSWFMRTFRRAAPCHHSRRARIYSATAHGRVPYQCPRLAAAAATALTATSSHADYVLTGPELLSYDEVAQRISRHRETITHYSLTFDELVLAKSQSVE